MASVISGDANVSAAEFGYLDGVTSGLQSQIDAKLAAGAGRILQVVQATTTTSTTIASTSLTDTGLSASITPSATSSKILVIVEQAITVSRSSTATSFGLGLLRGSSVIYANNQDYEEQFIIVGATSITFRGRFTRTYLDSPNTTSSTTYKTQGRLETTANSSQIVCQGANVMSTITLIEVSG